jgi:DNA-binding NarL/FixJ family response regulator
MLDSNIIPSAENAFAVIPERRPGSSATSVCAPAARLWPDFLTGQEKKPVRVLLIDDDEYMRRVIAQELLSDLRIQLEGQADSIREGRKLMATHEFDVLMVDLRLSDGMGFELIVEARRDHSKSEVIVISTLEDDAHVLRAFELGATGYLLKNAWLQSFSDAVLHVVNGGAAITPRLARRLLQRLNHQTREQWDDDASPRWPSLLPPSPSQSSCRRRRRRLSLSSLPSNSTSLTPRESQILCFVASGYVSAEIGTKLGITGQTVNAHIKSIYKKLHVHSRAQAVNFAVHSGLI